jgi:hypothetical protein
MVSLVANRNRQTVPAQNKNALIGRSLRRAVWGTGLVAQQKSGKSRSMFVRKHAA